MHLPGWLYRPFRPKFYQRTYHHQPEYDFRTLLHGDGYQLNCPYGKYACGFALILGTGIGLAIHLGDKIRAGALMMEKASSRIVKSSPSALDRKEFTETLITIIVIFVASGTGIYGSIVSGMTGDHSIMIAKSILDLFTAIIFSCTLGSVVSLIAIPQFILFMTLFLLAGVIYPLTTPAMINDFKAVGGFFMLAAGFRMNKVTNFPTADMIPAMLLIMPFSWIWSSFILPLVS